ncbi:MAG: DUF2721 domain-containing protein [Methylocella sp.]
MFELSNTVVSLDTVAHVIQVALTPVFLLSGVATLLGVFSTRLGRVSDRVDRLSEAAETAAPEEAARLSVQLEYLRRRSLDLDVAVLLGAVGGGATCAATLTLFVGALRNAAAASILFTLFGVAVLCTLGALTAFVTEMLMAGKGLRIRAAHCEESFARSQRGGANP